MDEHYTNDHDLLIELRTEMKGLRTDIRDLRDNLTNRVTQLENNKVDKEDFDVALKLNCEQHDKLVPLNSFEPVRNLVYGCATIILSSVVLGLVYLVIKQ